MSTKPTSAQRRWLKYMANNNGLAEISGMRDLEMADRLAEKGLARVFEKRPGFYGIAITDAGRVALEQGS